MLELFHDIPHFFKILPTASKTGTLIPLFLTFVSFNFYGFSENKKSKRGTNPPNCTISDNSVFDNYILVDKSFANGLRNLETCQPVNNNLFRKLVLSLESSNTYDERFKASSAPFCITDFD